MSKRTNLLAFPANLLDDPCFYRCLGPLAALRQKRPSMAIQVIENVNWASLSMNDIVMLQRPHSANQLKIAEMAVSHGLPLWVDHDDDVFNLPKGHPAYDNYMVPQIHARIANIIRLADVVTVSTVGLKKVVERFNPNTHVVPNALMSNMVGAIRRSDAPRTNLVYWRGSSTHQRDLDRYTPQMIEVAKRNPGTPWLFHGISGANYKLVESIPNASRAARVDPIEYFAMISNMRPRVFVVPLEDNPFNHSKSNIAWLEATYAGAVCVAPLWDEWERPGVLNYTPETFADVLHMAMNLTPQEHERRWAESAEYISTQLDIEAVNGKRSAIIDELEPKRHDLLWRSARRDAIIRRRQQQAEQPPASA